jgi:CHRD domain-containing protein
MGKVLYVSIAAAAVAALAVGSLAIAGSGTKNASGDLIGYQEVPAVSSAGTGSFHAKVNQDDSSFDWTLSYGGEFNGAIQQSHIHFGQRSVNGGIVVFLCTNLGNGPAGTQPCPAPPATISGTATAADMVNLAAAQGLAAGEFDELLDAIRAGKTYANLHTTTQPGGEIRAQLND